MKPIDKIFLIFMDYIVETLPPLLDTAGADNFDTYIIGPPSDDKEKQLGIYLGTGAHTPANSSEDFMMQAQLPKVSDPIAYRVAIDKALIGFDASKVLANSLSFVVVAYYPWEIKDGGGSSFIKYEISFDDKLTDCRSEDNY